VSTENRRPGPWLAPDDNGGVHINSGIPNHAFYLAATAIGGDTWTVLGRIWYVTLTARVSAGTEFQDFANATVLVAGQIYGVGGSVQRVVVDAWEAVGISVPAALTMHPAIKARRIGPSQQ
jgi:Zn-dependent metalloprotease